MNSDKFCEFTNLIPSGPTKTYSNTSTKLSPCGSENASGRSQVFRTANDTTESQTSIFVCDGSDGWWIS